ASLLFTLCPTPSTSTLSLHDALPISLGGIESLLSASVADGMADTRHDSNQELIGQGIANLLCPLAGGIAATGAIARTAANIRNRSEEHTSELQSHLNLVCRLLLEKKK